MSDRFDLGPLFAGLRAGLRDRLAVGEESPDKVARRVLVLVPLVMVGLSIWLDWQIRKPEALLAGFSLLAGSLLGVFSQLAGWRTRLSERAAIFMTTERRYRRAVDEAVAHTLVGALGSMAGAILMIVLANVMPDTASVSSVLPWPARIITGLAVGVGSYLFLTFIIIVNLLWDAYGKANEGVKGESQRGAG